MRTATKSIANSRPNPLYKRLVDRGLNPKILEHKRPDIRLFVCFGKIWGIKLLPHGIAFPGKHLFAELDDLKNIKPVPGLRLLQVEVLTKNMRSFCVEYDINILDDHGNTQLFVPEPFLDIQISGISSGRKTGMEKDLFDGRARVIFEFLSNHPDSQYSVRAISAQVNVPLSSTHRALGQLLDAGFAVDTGNGIKLTDDGYRALKANSTQQKRVRAPR